MIEYFITQRYTCDWCKGSGLNLTLLGADGQKAVEEQKSLVPLELVGRQSISDFTCTHCGGSRYTDTQLDADKWFLEKMEAVRVGAISQDDGDNCFIAPRYRKPRGEE